MRLYKEQSLVIVGRKMVILKLNPSKSNLFHRKVNYLGHIRTDSEKISAVEIWTLPVDVYFLRLFIYYRRFVTGFLIIAQFLHKLNEAKQRLLWTG